MDIAELEFILENKPEDTNTIAIRLGKTRKLHHQATLKTPISNEDVFSAIEENGFGAIYSYGKLIFYDKDSRQLRSKNFETTLEDTTNTNSLKTMVDGYLALAHELRRRAAIDTDVIIRRESTIENLIDKFVTINEAYQMEKFASMKYKEELLRVEEEAAAGYKQKALEAGVEAVNKYLSMKGTEIAEEQIIDFIINKPDLLIEAISSRPESIQSLMANEEFMNLIMNTINPLEKPDG
jgi:hypothetical protein